MSAAARSERCGLRAMRIATIRVKWTVSVAS